MASSDEDDVPTSMFDEPEGYRETEKADTYESYQLKDGRKVHVKLVGNSPLWGHLLWNGARRLAHYLQDASNTTRLVTGKHVLELGAGAGLPSVVAAYLDAVTVVITDYPDAALIDNIKHNIFCCIALPRPDDVVAEGYLWGADSAALTQYLPAGAKGRFDTLLLADLLFNHSEHAKLVRTVRQLLARTKEARALVFFTPYRPWLLQKDLAFFDLVLASNQGEDLCSGEGSEIEKQPPKSEEALGVTKLFEEVLERVMFKEDPGDETLRRTVFGYEIFWQDLQI